MRAKRSAKGAPIHRARQGLRGLRKKPRARHRSRHPRETCGAKPTASPTKRLESGVDRLLRGRQRAGGGRERRESAREEAPARSREGAGRVGDRRRPGPPGPSLWSAFGASRAPRARRLVRQTPPRGGRQTRGGPAPPDERCVSLPAQERGKRGGQVRGASRGAARNGSPRREPAPDRLQASAPTVIRYWSSRAWASRRSRFAARVPAPRTTTVNPRGRPTPHRTSPKHWVIVRWDRMSRTSSAVDGPR